MTVTILSLAAGLVTGALLGVGYFGGLAITVRQLSTSSRPALVFASSYLARILGLAVVLVIVARVSSPALVATLPGILAGRMIVTRRARRHWTPGGATTEALPHGGAAHE